jgi:hypothetical protein
MLIPRSFENLENFKYLATRPQIEIEFMSNLRVSKFGGFLLPFGSGTIVFSVGFEVLTAVVMKSTIFWDITPCCSLSVN